MASIFSKIRNWFKGPNPSAPQPPIGRLRGHRGVAERSAKQPDLSPENVAKWEPIQEPEVEAFVHGNQILPVHSSNVESLQYFAEDKKLLVSFLGKDGRPGSAYLYSNIQEHEALLFAAARSKGEMVWNMLRVRSSKTAHRKPFVRIR